MISNMGRYEKQIRAEIVFNVINTATSAGFPVLPSFAFSAQLSLTFNQLYYLFGWTDFAMAGSC